MRSFNQESESYGKEVVLAPTQYRRYWRIGPAEPPPLKSDDRLVCQAESTTGGDPLLNPEGVRCEVVDELLDRIDQRRGKKGEFKTEKPIQEAEQIAESVGRIP